jgi:hypothetical protein
MAADKAEVMEKVAAVEERVSETNDKINAKTSETLNIR